MLVGGVVQCHENKNPTGILNYLILKRVVVLSISPGY